MVLNRGVLKTSEEPEREVDSASEAGLLVIERFHRQCVLFRSHVGHAENSTNNNQQQPTVPNTKPKWMWLSKKWTHHVSGAIGARASQVQPLHRWFLDGCRLELWSKRTGEEPGWVSFSEAKGWTCFCCLLDNTVFIFIIFVYYISTGIWRGVFGLNCGPKDTDRCTGENSDVDVGCGPLRRQGSRSPKAGRSNVGSKLGGPGHGKVGNVVDVWQFLLVDLVKFEHKLEFNDVTTLDFSMANWCEIWGSGAWGCHSWPSWRKFHHPWCEKLRHGTSKSAIAGWCGFTTYVSLFFFFRYCVLILLFFLCFLDVSLLDTVRSEKPHPFSAYSLWANFSGARMGAFGLHHGLPATGHRSINNICLAIFWENFPFLFGEKTILYDFMVSEPIRIFFRSSHVLGKPKYVAVSGDCPAALVWGFAHLVAEPPNGHRFSFENLIFPMIFRTWLPSLFLVLKALYV